MTGLLTGLLFWEYDLAIPCDWRGQTDMKKTFLQKI